VALRRRQWGPALAAVLLTAIAARADDSEGPGLPPLPSPPAASPWSSSAAVGLGPLAQGSGSPASTFRLVQPPAAPVTLGRGQWEISAQADWANFFCDGGDRYLLDYESLRLRLGAGYGVTERTQVGLGGVLSYQGGGVLDSFIEWFERSIGAINRDRVEAPGDRHLIRVRSADGSVHEWRGEESGWDVDSLALAVKHQVLEGSETTPAVVVTGVLKLPGRSNAPGRADGGVDLGGSLAVGQRLGRFNLYGSLGAVRFGETDVGGVELYDSQLSLMAGAEYRATPRTSILLQVMVSSAVAHHLGDLSERSREAALGVKHRLGERCLLEVSAGENLVVFANSADIVFRAGLSWRP